ncbi:U1A small nuclear ribonucleoprotein [Strigomonas culicis]|uniref:U1A small nuclear ribonucleoprotein n=1 Tax=Strigomonas culicis TaxID=28005 RepID=S9VVP2_9TRYP|nr:U1A small nuclear ribonucleoprotein [Strigomonas culicis]|eukprot:EPY27465.1 U1A small nuclear ribonucleoprotein [Strigomonas culicis]
MKENTCMEYVAVSGLSFPVGTESTRQSLYRLFTPIGSVEDILLNEQNQTALVCFGDPICAQEAILALDNCVLFSKRLKLSISGPPRSEVPGFLVTLKPTCYLLLKNTSFLFLLVLARRMSGIESIQWISYQTALVYTKSADISVCVKEMVGPKNRSGHKVTSTYLKRE